MYKFESKTSTATDTISNLFKRVADEFGKSARLLSTSPFGQSYDVTDNGVTVATIKYVK